MWGLMKMPWEGEVANTTDAPSNRTGWGTGKLLCNVSSIPGRSFGGRIKKGQPASSQAGRFCEEGDGRQSESDEKRAARKNPL